jgi:SNF2 family DNA or RNA helicase
LIDENYKIESGKEEILNDLIDIIMDRGEKVIIWTSFIENVNYIARKYNMYDAVKVHGNISYEERNRHISNFKNDPDCKILVATPSSAKEGLTLTVANNAIFYDRNLSLDDYLQAQDRIHRISQKRLFYLNLVMENSIDILVDMLLQSKYLSLNWYKVILQ